MPHRILIVDDSADDAYFTEVGVRRAMPDAIVRIERTGEAAMAAVLPTGEDWLPSLIVLDMNLPMMEGDEFLRSMGRQGLLSSVPIIAVSGALEEVAAPRMIDAGADCFVSKSLSFPIYRDEIARSVRERLPNTLEAPETSSAA